MIIGHHSDDWPRSEACPVGDYWPSAKACPVGVVAECVSPALWALWPGV